MSETILSTHRIRRPDDMHLHLRDGAMLTRVAPITAAHFARAIIMPNLVPPVVTASDAEAYRARILKAVGDAPFEPLMVLYLTEETDPADVAAGAASGLVKALKLYPAGATTNSQSGIRDIEKAYPVLEKMAEIGLPLCVHGEVTDPEIDIFDREAVFLERVLDPIRRRLPELRVVLEHVTTADGIAYIKDVESGLAGTLTTHHLMVDRNHMLVGGIRPHYYCLPVVKRRQHREALREAAVSGDPRFFLGTDSAPHTDNAKENPCGCAGCFTALNTLGCLASVFEEMGALDALEGFTSTHGAAFYGLPPAMGDIVLEKLAEPAAYPAKLDVEGAETLTIFSPPEPIHWRVREES